METAIPLGLALTLAFLAEGMTEYFSQPLLESLHWDTRYLRYIAALVGVGLALAYDLDVLKSLLGFAAPLPYVGEVLTGLMLGRGANYIHDFSSSYLQREKKAI